MDSKFLTSKVLPALDDKVTQDQFLDGRLTLLQPRTGYRAAIDPILLAAAIDIRPGQSVLELGCGNGIVLLCLARRVLGIDAIGLELQSQNVELARQNASLNKISLQVIQGNVDKPPQEIRQRRFEHVIANPPYHLADQGVAPNESSQRLASVESLPLSVWAESASRRLNPGGSLGMILPAIRLKDLMTCLPDSLGGIEIKPIRPRLRQDAHRILLRATKGSRKELRLVGDLILHPDGEGQKYSQEAEDVLRHCAPIKF